LRLGLVVLGVVVRGGVMQIGGVRVIGGGLATMVGGGMVQGVAHDANHRRRFGEDASVMPISGSGPVSL
jgi:hypothetical protein